MVRRGLSAPYSYGALPQVFPRFNSVEKLMIENERHP